MIKLNGVPVTVGYFPDGTLLFRQKAPRSGVSIEWKFESNEELVTLIFLTRHLREHGVDAIALLLPYVPNARQDRVKEEDDIFTLKYFAEVINSLGFDRVFVVDPHSSVTTALIDRVHTISPRRHIERAYDAVFGKTWSTAPMLFYPDEGAMKRYSGLIDAPYAFGIKQRNWATGEIRGLRVCSDNQAVEGEPTFEGHDVLIVDDICSRGGTFYHSAKKLKELGAKDVYLYVTHCENTVLEGDLLKGDIIKRVYTTNSIFTKQHEKIEVFEL